MVQYGYYVDAPVQQCTCDKSSDLHFAVTRYIAGFDETCEFTCEYCQYDKLYDFPNIEEISNQFMEDKVRLMNVRRGPFNLGLFDIINKMIDTLIRAEDAPYVKFREHLDIQYRIQELNSIIQVFTSILNN